MNCVLQDWVMGIPMMQQTVMMTAVRGPDGLPKYGPTKMLLRWYRRSFLKSSVDQRVLATPHEEGGGSFTGPSYVVVGSQSSTSSKSSSYASISSPTRHPHESVVWENRMDNIVGDYLQVLDAVPHHFQLHFIHGAEVLGYQHPDKDMSSWWIGVYQRLVNDMHLNPESREVFMKRLGDSEKDWREANDPATQR